MEKKGIDKERNRKENEWRTGHGSIKPYEIEQIRYLIA
jgi:hypothetical protein